MNSKLLVSLMLGALPLTMVAQDDDMYFVPAKKSTAVRTRTSVAPRPAPVYYSGSNRDVDEYNRRGGSYYQVVSNDSTGNDIIDFNGEVGVYPDSVLTEDYALTRQMSRWDGTRPGTTHLIIPGTIPGTTIPGITVTTAGTAAGTTPGTTATRIIIPGAVPTGTAATILTTATVAATLSPHVLLERRTTAASATAPPVASATDVARPTRQAPSADAA